MPRVSPVLSHKRAQPARPAQPFSRSCAARRFALCFMLIAGALFAFAGCTEGEKKQRATFIKLLRKDVLEQSGLHFPTLTKEQTQELGPYAEQYEILTAPLKNDDVFKHYNELITLQHELENTAEPERKKEALQKAADSFEAAQDAIAGMLDKLQIQRESLKQPEDLSAVYEEAYQKLIVRPFESELEVLDVAQSYFAAADELNEFVLANKSSIVIKGTSYSTAKPDVQKKLQELIAKRNAALDDLKDSANTMEEATTGSKPVKRRFPRPTNASLNNRTNEHEYEGSIWNSK